MDFGPFHIAQENGQCLYNYSWRLIMCKLKERGNLYDQGWRTHVMNTYTKPTFFGISVYLVACKINWECKAQDEGTCRLLVKEGGKDYYLRQWHDILSHLNSTCTVVCSKVTWKCLYVFLASV